MDKKTLEAVFTQILSPNGFKKKRSAWYREVQGVIQGVDLQRSFYGAQFYVNLFFVPEGISVEGMPTPKEYKCPIRIRLTSIIPERCKDIDALFDLEKLHLSESERISGIQEVISHILATFLNSLQSNGELKSAIEKNIFRNGWVNLVAQKHLSIDP
jgi:hypothetical protein